MIYVLIKGRPKAQPRTRRKAGGGGYTPTSADGWKWQIAAALKPLTPKEPIESPVSLEVDFYMPRPKKYQTKKYISCNIPHTAKPDMDNLLKAVMDVCRNIGVWKDDSQIVSQRSTKFYAAENQPAGARIKIIAI